MSNNHTKRSPKSKGKANANTDAQDKPTTPVRQTRARSRLRNAPPLMTGLDPRTGLPKETLPADPEALAYNDVVQRLSGNANTAANKTANRARRNTKIILRRSKAASSSSGQPGSGLSSSTPSPPTAGSFNQNQSASSTSEQSARSSSSFARNHSGPDASRSNAGAQGSSTSDDSSNESDGSGNAPLGQSSNKRSDSGGSSGYEASGEKNSHPSDLSRSSNPGSSRSVSPSLGSSNPGPGHSNTPPASSFDGESESSGDDADDERSSEPEGSHSSSSSSSNSVSSEEGTPPDGSPYGNIDTDHSGPSANGSPNTRNNSVSTTSQTPETGSLVDDADVPIDPALYTSILGQTEEAEDARRPILQLETSPTCSGSLFQKRRQSSDSDDDDDAPVVRTKRRRFKSPEEIIEASTTTYTSVVATQVSESREPRASTSNALDSGVNSPIGNPKAAFANMTIPGENSASGEASPMIPPTFDPEIPDMYGSGLRPRLHYDWYEQYHHTGLDCAKVHGCTHSPGRVCHPCHAEWHKAWAGYFKAEELLQEAAAYPEKYLKEAGLDIRKDFMGSLMQGSGWEVLAPELRPPAGGKVRIHPARAAKHKLALVQATSV